MLAGYTLSSNRIEGVAVDVSPNFLINVAGPITPDVVVNSPTATTRCPACGASNADKPNQFKLTGMYILPWYDVIVSGNYSGVSGPADTRQHARARAVGAPPTTHVAR